jgi:hypothetical protein
MTALEDLAAREASGVLEVTGRPSGAIYLDRGRIAFARASWVPGLVARLREVTPALADVPETEYAVAAGLAVRLGYLTPRALHELIGSVVVDAFVVLTVPPVADSFVSGMRFTATRIYWTEMFPRLGVGQLRQEAFRTVQPARYPAEELMARHLGPGQVATLDVLWRVLNGLKKLS